MFYHQGEYIYIKLNIRTVLPPLLQHKSVPMTTTPHSEYIHSNFILSMSDVDTHVRRQKQGLTTTEMICLIKAVRVTRRDREK